MSEKIEEYLLEKFELEEVTGGSRECFFFGQHEAFKRYQSSWLLSVCLKAQRFKEKKKEGT